MDIYTFIVELVKALAWPVTIGIGFIFLHKPFISLIPFMRKLKFKELEMEFSQQIQAMKLEADIEENSELMSPAMNILSFSTRAAVMEAWIELETVAASKAASFWSSSDTSPFRNNVRLGNYLHQCNVIDKNQLKSFNELRKLRNELAHIEEVNLTDSDAKAYIEVAANLVQHIKHNN